MTTEMDEPAAGGDWSLHSYVFHHAFSKLATAFRWMFWGLLLQLLGGGIAAAPFFAMFIARAKLDAKLVVPGLIAMAVGGIILLIGEQKCLHLELPLGMTRELPGHKWLRAAYWCHLGSWLLRMGRQFLDRKLVAMVLLPMQFLGFLFLLLFLRKTADVLSRRDLKRLVDLIFVIAGMTVVSGVLLAAEISLNLQILKALPRVLGLSFFALPVVLFIATTGAYIVLLGHMASAAATFAKYLNQVDETPAPADNEEAAEETA